MSDTDVMKEVFLEKIFENRHDTLTKRVFADFLEDGGDKTHWKWRLIALIEEHILKFKVGDTVYCHGGDKLIVTGYRTVIDHNYGLIAQYNLLDAETKRCTCVHDDSVIYTNDFTKLGHSFPVPSHFESKSLKEGKTLSLLNHCKPDEAVGRFWLPYYVVEVDNKTGHTENKYIQDWDIIYGWKKKYC